MNDGATSGARVGGVLGGKYRLVRALAEGGMGWVYEARHDLVRRRFAVKVLRPELARRRDLLARFRDEAVAAGALESEHVVAVVDFGFADDGVPYLVMEYLAGETLADLMTREGRLPVGRAVDLIAQACEGVAVAHAAGILHRDLKPRNLFICRHADGSDLVKVLDFGVAKLESEWRDAESPTATGPQHWLGTPAYMSPEQARGERSLDARSDLFSLATILYEALAGERPHHAESPAALVHQIASQPARPLAAHVPTLPRGLAEAIGIALALDREERPSSVTAWRDRLRPFEGPPTVWPAPPELPAGLPPDVSRPGQRPFTSVAPQRGLSWRKMVLVGLAVAGVGVAIGARRLLRALEHQGPLPQRRGFAWARETRFFVPPPRSGAVQQIAGLVRAGAVDKAALLTALEAVPRAVWFNQGSPTDVEEKVRAVTARAARNGTVPVLVASNIPYRDCAQDSAGGTSDNSSYAAWIEGFARGVGHQRAVVILEPDSIGIIPYNRTLEGTEEWCQPTVLDANGRTVPASGADPAARYAALRTAVERFRALAPGAAVYLDATHAAWLPVPEVAFRLAQAGVDAAQGFFVNVASTQTTEASLGYGTAIARCLARAGEQQGRGRLAMDYAVCKGAALGGVDDVRGAWPHFVIDTSRNGRGPLVASRYAKPPYHQPASVIEALARGGWCNPPGTGAGAAPTADTGHHGVDAFLWVKPPGESDGSCDLAGGTRDWDYGRYNPWNLSGEAARHFDPLWGMVDPAGGEWFAEQALELAVNASPPLSGAASLSAPPTR